MDWRQAIEEERAALQRIASLLLALGRLAELACGRSLAVCAVMVWILRPAEAAASAYVDRPSNVMPAPRSGDARSEATYLARRFRACAREIIRHAKLALRWVQRRWPLNRGGLPGAPRLPERQAHDVLAQALAVEALKPLDTS